MKNTIYWDVTPYSLTVYDVSEEVLEVNNKDSKFKDQKNPVGDK